MERVRKCEDISIPVTAIGELYYGAFNSSRINKNVQRIEQLISTTLILECDSGTARNYGEIKKALKEQGTPIPENDIWIAALAVQHDAILAARDRHFEHIGPLRSEQW